jgi:hypothetical protein
MLLLSNLSPANSVLATLTGNVAKSDKSSSTGEVKWMMH